MQIGVKCYKMLFRLTCSDPGHFLEATLSRVAFFVLCICTYRKSGVGCRELVACLPAKAGRESTAPLNWC